MAMKVEVGERVGFTKRITEADVVAFVAISGDDYEAHTDEALMARSSYGQRLVHGALLVALMSAAGTKLIRAVKARGDDTTPVSLGYDRLRFVAPVFFGDLVTVTYVVTSVDRERARSSAELVASNETGVTVAIGEHVMKWLQPIEPVGPAT
jgi:3-hydroxybutyryl-CoA dehydratase